MGNKVDEAYVTSLGDWMFERLNKLIRSQGGQVDF